MHLGGPGGPEHFSESSRSHSEGAYVSIKDATSEQGTTYPVPNILLTREEAQYQGDYLQTQLASEVNDRHHDVKKTDSAATD